MAKLALAVLEARKAANGMYPIFVRIAAKKEKVYIKTMYELSDLSQWYNGKVVARTDAAMMNKRLLFELRKYDERVKSIENYDTYTANQLKLVITQTDKIAPVTSGKSSARCPRAPGKVDPLIQNKSADFSSGKGKEKNMRARN